MLLLKLEKLLNRSPRIDECYSRKSNLFSIENTFSNLNYYEFVSDKYATCNGIIILGGRLFSRIPFMRKYQIGEK